MQENFVKITVYRYPEGVFDLGAFELGGVWSGLQISGRADDRSVTAGQMLYNRPVWAFRFTASYASRMVKSAWQSSWMKLWPGFSEVTRKWYVGCTCHADHFYEMWTFCEFLEL